MRRLYYNIIKPILPRWLQIYLRRALVRVKLLRYRNVWPIDSSSGIPPEGFTGWPEKKKFALVLTHDVDTQRGHDRCRSLMEIEKSMGFRSSFNFVAKKYTVSRELREEIASSGFEVGLHGLYHDGRLYESKEIFLERARILNQYLKDWNVVGFRSPSMHHRLDWIHELDIEYDASTFDTDPFEPQPDGMGTIFPFFVKGEGEKGYVELPYTLPQDFTLFIIMGHRDTHIWEEKLEWIVEKGGMALMNTHPDYMVFKKEKPSIEEYPVEYYSGFLEYIKKNYEGEYWHVLPREIARFWRGLR
ncbi:MAG: hypothetical protein N2745_07645 [Syntrophorhabdaceae bacterium]|nr:hypothetical protein [Syntrophorhabdaceae bacterium]